MQRQTIHFMVSNTKDFSCGAPRTHERQTSVTKTRFPKPTTHHNTTRLSSSSLLVVVDKALYSAILIEWSQSFEAGATIYLSTKQPK